MNVRAMYVPNSAHGRAVACVLRALGCDLRDDQVLGRRVANLPCKLNWHELRAIAYALDPARAQAEEADAMERADAIRSDARNDGMRSADIERMASIEERAWLR